MIKKIFLALSLSICCLFSFSQDTAHANQLVEEGIALHDKNQYAEAIAKYHEALLASPDYTRALYELSYTYYANGTLDSYIILGERLLKMNVSDDIRKQVYVTLGSVYDENKQPDKAEETYKQGIKSSLIFIFYISTSALPHTIKMLRTLKSHKICLKKHFLSTRFMQARIIYYT